MNHIHRVYDTDPHFSVDSQTRIITDMSTTSTHLMQYDHNSERFTFDIPRFIDNHDMSTCNKVEVHYINIGTNSQRNSGLYEVDDLEIDPDNEDTVVCTWLISQNATALNGSLSFLLRFMCIRDGVIDYVWNTEPYSSISVGTGMNNSKVIATQYADLLQNWYNQFIAAGNEHLAQIDGRVEAATQIAFTQIEEKTEEVVESETEMAVAAIHVQADEIVNIILDRMPRAEGVGF